MVMLIIFFLHGFTRIPCKVIEFLDENNPSCQIFPPDIKAK